MQDQFLRFTAVRSLIGLSRSTVWRLEKSGDFPRRRQIAPNSVAWLRSDLDRWIKQRGLA